MSKNRVKKLPFTDRLSYIWLAIGFILVLFTYGMYRNPLAGLLASVFLIRFIRTRKIGIGYLLLLLTLMVASTISWWNVNETIPTIAHIIFGAIFGFMYSIPFLLDRLLVPRFQGFTATLIFPFTLAAFEFLTIWPNPLSTYGSIAYSQFSSLYFTQLISITGLWGVTFLIGWFASTINWIWEEDAVWSHIRRGVAIYAAAMLVVLLYGIVRLTFLPEPGTVRIHGIVETDYTVKEWEEIIKPLSATDSTAFQAITALRDERYLQATIREAQAGAQIVVWPEVAVEGLKEDVEVTLERARDVARQEGIYLALGTGVVTPEPPDFVQDNRLVMIDPQGEIVVDQLKYGCTAPNMYDFEVQTLDTPFGRIAGVVCCDLDYPYVLRQLSQKGVDILLVPSFEPTAANLVAHSQMAPFRAIENGFSIFRPTIQGISQAIDPYGRTLGTMNHTTADETVLVAQLPNQKVFTVYSVIGDSTGWLFVVGFLILVGWALYQSRKSKAVKPAKSERAAAAH